MKFRVLPTGIIYITIYDLLSFIALGFVIIVPSEKEVWLWIMSAIMFVFLPIVVSIYILSFSLDVIKIDENGVKKYHFGKLKKKFEWNEILTSNVYPNNELYGWVYLSNHKIEYNFLSSTFMMFDKRSICIKYTEKVVLELNKYLIKKIIINE